MICQVILLSRSSSGIPDEDARNAVRRGQRLTRIRCYIGSGARYQGTLQVVHRASRCVRRRDPHKQTRLDFYLACLRGSLLLTTPAKGRRTTLRGTSLCASSASSEPSVLAL